MGDSDLEANISGSTSDQAREAMQRVARGVLTPVFSFRYRWWRCNRQAARAVRWARRDWRPLVFGVGALVGCLVAGSRIRVGGHPAREGRPAVVGHPLATTAQVVAVFALLGFLRLAWEARKRTVFQDIVDGTGTYPNGVVPGLSAMLAAEVSRLAGLYRSIDAQLTSSQANLDLQDPLRATLQVDDTAQFLQGAVAADSEVGLGPLKIPVGAILAMVARLLRGPRVSGYLQWDADRLVLVARYDGPTPKVWRVTGPPAATAGGGTGPRGGVKSDSSPTATNGHPSGAPAGGPFALGQMVEDLGCHIFTDLALRGTVRCQAAAAFTKAMQTYVDEGRRGRGDPGGLHKVSDALLEAIAADADFHLAWYNLGVIYDEQRKPDLALRTFARAREQNAGRWDVTYALARPGRSSDSGPIEVPAQESIVRQLLCDEVIRQHPGPAAEAQAYDLRGFLEAPTHNNRNQRRELNRQAGDLFQEAAVVAALPGPHPAEDDRAVKRARRHLNHALTTENLTAAADALKSLAGALRAVTSSLIDPDAAVSCNILAERADSVATSCRPIAVLRLDNREEQVRMLAQAGRSQRLAARRAWKALRRAEWAVGPVDIDEDAFDAPVLRRHARLASTCLVHLAVTFLDSTELDSQDGIADLGRRRRAEVLLRQAVRLDVADPEAHYRLGRVFTRGGRNARWLADQELRKAVALDPLRAHFWSRLLKLRVLAGDGPGAMVVLAAYLPLSPPPLRAPELHSSHRRVVVGCLIDPETSWPTTGQSSWVSDEEPMTMDPAELEQLAQRRRGDLGLRLRAMPLRIEWLSALSRLASEGDPFAWAQLWEQLGTTKGHDDEGWEHAATAWALKDGFDGYLAATGTPSTALLAILVQELKDAVSHIHRTNPAICRREGLRGDLAQWLTQHGEQAEAVSQAERALRDDPISPFELSVLGDAYFAMEDYALADDAYRRASQWEEEPSEISRLAWGRAACLINQVDDRRGRDRLDEALGSAIARLHEAMRLLDESQTEERIFTHYWLGRAHAEQRDFDQAIPHLRTASHRYGTGDRFERVSSCLTGLLALANARAANGLYEEAASTYLEVEQAARELVRRRSDLDQPIGRKLQEERTLAEVLVLALAGQAEHLVRRRANLQHADELLRRAHRFARRLNGEARRRSDARLHNITGLVEWAAGNTVGAERHLQQAIDQLDSARTYLDLVGVYVRQLDDKDSRTRRTIAYRIRDLIQHVSEIDLRDEWTTDVTTYLAVVDRVLAQH